MAETRATLTFDQSGVHVSADYTWNSGDLNTFPTQGNAKVYEAYVSTDLMGFASMSLGRQDLSFGSGMIIGSNNWGSSRWTTDGLNLNMNLGGFDINAGTMEMGAGAISQNTTYVNANGSFSGVSINALMVDNDGLASSGYDLGYTIMDGALSLNYSMNVHGNINALDGTAQDAELTVMGGSYQVFENMSVSASMREYAGEGDFLPANSPNTTTVLLDGSVIGGLEAGVLPHLTNGHESLSYGIDYTMGAISINYTMHTISNNTVVVLGEFAGKKSPSPAYSLILALTDIFSNTW
jgi:hypothetical protein